VVFGERLFQNYFVVCSTGFTNYLCLLREVFVVLIAQNCDSQVVSSRQLELAAILNLDFSVPNQRILFQS